MTLLYLYDDALGRSFEPFTVTRPVCELRAGVAVIRHRWERATARQATGCVAAPGLEHFAEAGAAPVAAPDHVLAAGSVLANSRFVLALDEVLATNDTVWSADQRVCAVRLRDDTPVARLADGATSLEQLAGPGTAAPLRGRWLDAVWDLVGQLSDQLMHDIAALAHRVHASSMMYDSIGTFSLTVEEDAHVEPFVVFDVTAGPVLIRRGAHISAFTRIVGPCYIGPDASIVGDRVANCAIGDRSKIRGEISSSVVLGYSNKGHTGFVGHSYIGRWVNLGSGTTTSNLKNTYGSVQLWTPGGLRDTGQQFLGTLFGDHSKTGIGTMLTTGTVIGAGANVFGSDMPPKYVPPFAWGEREPYAAFDPEKFLAVAERVMSRRQVPLGPAERRHLERVHADRALR